MKKALIIWLVLLGFPFSADAVDTFPGAPDKKAGDFIKLSDHLDDPNRGLCIDIPGHLQGVDTSAALVVHTCKDGFWNYDERFLPESLEQNQGLVMPAFERCVAAEKIEPNAQLRLAVCDSKALNQSWELTAARIRLKARPELCIEVDSAPSEVSIGTRTHPVQHLVRPIYLGKCDAKDDKYQQWQFVTPSDISGIRYPDGGIGE